MERLGLGARELSTPPPPPGFTLDQPARAPVRLRSAISAPPPEGFTLDGEARDGDTFPTIQGPDLRLYGADAPELNQQGWRRDMTPVAIGQQARAIADGLVDPTGEIGTLRGYSFGRPVAPIMQDGRDVGQSLIRSGNALAAPGYLKGDPRYPTYMDAERLARQNRLGVHGVYAQTPEDYRRAPDKLPDRETVAQFWDTPTPQSGLRPEIERGYLAIQRTGSADDILAYASANGFTIDPAQTRKFVKARDARRPVAYEVTYDLAPKPLTNVGDGAVGAAARGVGDGVLPNLLDEVGALPDALGVTDNRENVWNSDRRWADIYWNNVDQNRAIIGYDDMAHPYARLGGEIAGGLVLPFGAKATTVPQLAKVGGAYGAAAGFGAGDTIPDRLIQGAVGAGTGAVGGAVVGKALQAGLPKLAAGWRWARGRGGEPVAVPDAPAGAPEGAGGLPEGVPPPSRVPDRLDIGSLPQRAPEPPPPPLDTSYPGPAAGYTPPALTGDWQADEAAMAERAMQSYRDLVRRGIESDPDTGPEDYRPFSDYMAEWRDREAAARSGNRAAQDSIAAGLGYPPRERDWIDIGQIPPPPPGFKMDRPAAMDADPMPSVSSAVRQPDYLDLGQRPRPLLRDATEAERRAATAGIEPTDVLPIRSNEIGSVEEAAARDAGRVVEARTPDERAALTRRTVRGWNGSEVPKLGPIDLIGFLRLRGGMKDQAGELSHIGMNNAARKMDFAGEEHRFGPLVNDEGANLDDAAFAAWEAGYFPDLSERPDTATFLEALRDNYFGRKRNFLSEDLREIENHAAMRAERQDLEQQRFVEGAPLYTDRSMPADEPAPFPPVEAYEDWPSGGPDFAGNIRLEKLDSPQDIKRALATVNNRVGFDAATRGRVTQAETERLASELGMTPDTLLSRRKGQALNAEEALAARQILAKSGNELVNLARKVQRLERPGDDVAAAFQRALMRHVAIQEQVSGATAEAGRALQQFRMTANSNAVSGEVLASVVKAGGGQHRIKEAAETLIDAVESGPGVFNALAAKATKPRFADKLAELYINFLLSGPRTHVVNTVSNALTSLAQLPEHAAASMLGAGRAAVGKGDDRILASEVGARAFGLLQGTKEGARLFAQAIRTGDPSDTFTKVEGHDFKAISGLKGEIARIPTRLLTAEDEFFKGIARRMELNGLAVRQAHKEGLRGDEAKARIADLVADPTDDMLSKSIDYARYLTFQRPLKGLPLNISRSVTEHPILRPIITFVRTPTNLLKFAVERSPAAPLLKDWRADWKAGGARRDLAVARVMLGTGFATLMYEAAIKGDITGGPPADDAKARFMRADGWQPYSIRVGDKYYSYSRLDPFSTTIGVAADLATKADGMTDKQLDNYAALLVASIMNNLGEKTWLSGISDFTAALSDPQQHGPAWVRKMVGSMTVPTGVAQIADSIDPTARATNSWGDAIQARVPGLRDNLPAKRDMWGEPIVREGLGPDLLSPVWESTRRNDPLNREMLDIGATFGPPQKSYKVDGKRVEWSPEQYERLSELTGKGARDALVSAITDPAWKGLDGAGRLKVAERVFKQARAEAKAEVLGLPAPKGMFGNSGAKGRAAIPPPPPGFTVEGEAGGVNVYQDIQKAIPGVRFTSGFRTPEYQADMRRRGYSPDPNSDHLNGSKLDLLPPPGKSMGWLKEQVRRFRPDAELRDEGDHLDVRFPGYFGAPALGGAKAAGLRNPLAGMPPPPPGFKLDAR